MRFGRLLFAAGAVAILSLTHTTVLSAQAGAGERSAAVERSVDGRVRRPVKVGGDATGMGPAANTWVTVHRVAKDSAGPIDSVRSDAKGHYHLRWRPFGSADAVYFASVTWDGIAYFTPPLRSTNARGDDGEITVFDTTARTFPLSVRGRHLIVGKVDSTDARTVIEVFELSNDSLKTLVSADAAGSAPTWSIAIPASARDVRSTAGEIAPDAFAFTGGRVSVFAPLAPGIKQVSFSYKLPNTSFPLTLFAEHGASVFEVLIEDAKGVAAGPGFAIVDPVTLEQRTFRRFVAQDARDGAKLTVDVPSEHGIGRNSYIATLIVLIGCVMLLILARAMQRRVAFPGSTTHTRTAPATAVAAPAPTVSVHEQIAHEIAALDTRFEGEVAPSAEATAEYRRRRTELKDALRGALAESGALP